MKMIEGCTLLITPYAIFMIIFHVLLHNLIRSVLDFAYHQYGICRMYSEENPQDFRLFVSDFYSQEWIMLFLRAETSFKPYIITVNADNTVIDLPPFKYLLFLCKYLSDYGKPFQIIPGMPEWSSILSMNLISLYEELFKELDHAVLEHPCPLKPSSFFSCCKTDRTLPHPNICYADAWYRAHSHENSCDIFPKYQILWNPKSGEFLKYFVPLPHLCFGISPVWVVKPYFRGNTQRYEKAN